MGCYCLSSRSQSLPPDPDKPKSTAMLAETSSENSLSPLAPTTPINLIVNLRHESSVLRLNKRSQSTFSVISQVSSEKGQFSLYLGEFPASKKRCFVKSVPKSKFVQEAIDSGQVLEPLSVLDHPHILQTYEVCQDQDALYVLTEVYEGGTLRTLVGISGSLGEAWAHSVFQQVISAVAYAHRMNFIFTGLDPDHIAFKDSTGRDIRVIGSENRVLCIPGRPEFSVFGAPEVLSGEYSEKADVWSCGVLLYYLLSGEVPSAPGRNCGGRGSVLFKGFSFDPQVWGGVAYEAISLILSMVSWKAEARPSALECLEAPWVQRKQDSDQSSQSVRSSVSSLVSATATFPLRAAILRFIITRVAEDSDLSQLSQTFDSLDVDRDGLISAAELSQRLPANTKSPHSAAKEIIAKVDRNGNGMIDFSEFLLAAFEERKLLSTRRLKKAFSLLDRDGNGKISMGELKVAFSVSDSEGEESAWKKVIAECELGKDGEIGFAEFERFLRKPVEKQAHKRKTL